MVVVLVVAMVGISHRGGGCFRMVLRRWLLLCSGVTSLCGCGCGCGCGRGVDGERVGVVVRGRDKNKQRRTEGDEEEEEGQDGEEEGQGGEYAGESLVTERSGRVDKVQLK